MKLGVIVISSCNFYLSFQTAGGGTMQSSQEPPPPLAADAALSSLQAQLAVENLSVASTNLLDLIRTLQLSLLLMDQDTIAAEEEYQVQAFSEQTRQSLLEAAKLEAELMKVKNRLDEEKWDGYFAAFSSLRVDSDKQRWRNEQIT